MAEVFSQRIDLGLVESTARRFSSLAPDFPAARFIELASAGLDALPLKARVDQVADALTHCLPSRFDASAELIEASLAPPLSDASSQGDARSDGLTGWVVWPLGEYVARAGLQQPERALSCLHALTQRFTAEFAIRPFLLAHPERVFDILRTWVDDPSAHVRRLVSEGTRPRLPWGMRLQALVVDPSPSLPLLAALQDDASEYVRRSVANHLNDIGKDHPQRIADWLMRHLPDAGPERRRLLRHASRSLLKAGDAQVLAAWGLGQSFRGTVALAVAPRGIVLGESIELDVQLAGADMPQRLVIDYRVHHVKANGRTSPKVFKGWQLELAPGERRRLSRSHAIRAITTRRYYPGEHRVELLINGEPFGDAVFKLRIE